jgi:putative hydrolase of the HAD superfamily
MNGLHGTKALVLDFGGVISRMLFETHELSERALGLPPGTLTWKGPFDPASDLLWQDMQADKLSERDYWMIRTREVGHLVGEDWNSMETFVRRARGTDIQAVIRPEAVAAVEAARAAGKRLAILSNELDLFYGADFRSRLPLLRLFDVIVDATYTGILKPDLRAYKSVAEALGVLTSECVFVDDQRRNVDGAVRAGMCAVHFDVLQPAASFQQALSQLGMGSERQLSPTTSDTNHG